MDTCSLMSTQLPTLQLRGHAIPTGRCSPTLADTADMSQTQESRYSQPASKLEVLAVARPLAKAAASARERSRSPGAARVANGASPQAAREPVACTAEMVNPVAGSSTPLPSEWWSPPRRLLLVPPSPPRHERSWRPPGVIRWRG